MKNTTYYAVKETWGANPLELVATGSTLTEAKENAKNALQQQHGGLWAGIYRNCYIGSKKWLKTEFPAHLVDQTLNRD